MQKSNCKGDKSVTSALLQHRGTINERIVYDFHSWVQSPLSLVKKITSEIRNTMNGKFVLDVAQRVQNARQSRSFVTLSGWASWTKDTSKITQPAVNLIIWVMLLCTRQQIQSECYIFIFCNIISTHIYLLHLTIIRTKNKWTYKKSSLLKSLVINTLQTTFESQFVYVVAIHVLGYTPVAISTLGCHNHGR